jgi:hypothetical protein
MCFIVRRRSRKVYYNLKRICKPVHTFLHFYVAAGSGRYTGGDKMRRIQYTWDKTTSDDISLLLVVLSLDRMNVTIEHDY